MDSNKPSKKGTIVPVVKFAPLVLFIFLVTAFQLDMLMAAPIATFIAIVVYRISEKKSFEDAFGTGLEAVKGIIPILFILMMAYAVAEAFMATGVGAAVIRIAISTGVTGRSVAVVSLLATSALSTATGSSWGTFAACAPIFLWLSHLVGGDAMLTVCAIAGGSCFGDNLGMISDVTQLSCGLQDVKPIDRIKHQLCWSLGCLAVSGAIFYLCSRHLPATAGDPATIFNAIPENLMANLAAERPSAALMLRQVQDGVPIYMAAPAIIVIGMSFLKCHTVLCLGAGVISALALGAVSGTDILQAAFTADGPVYAGFSSAGSWVIPMMLWITAFSGIMNAMNAFEPLERLVTRVSRNVHQLMGWCAVLCLLGNAALADEAAQVTTMSPIIRRTAEDNVHCGSEDDNYRLRVKLATFTSSMGIYGSQLIPWHCFPVYFASIATLVYPQNGGFTPMDIISRNYTGFIMVGTILILTFTGWDRFVPKFGLPKSASLKTKT